MTRMAFAAALGVAAFLLSACSTTSDPARVLEALGKAYGHCERTVTYSAAVGPLNPSSGATVSGTVRCPAQTPPPAALTVGEILAAPPAEADAPPPY